VSWLNSPLSKGGPPLGTFGETGWGAVGACQRPIQPIRTCSTEPESRRPDTLDAAHKIHAGGYGRMSLVAPALTLPDRAGVTPVITRRERP
jgi:hypothetical protein